MRRLLALLLIFLFLISCLPATSSTSVSPRTPIEHVIYVMMENHSFDNVFGVYPTMNETGNANPYNLTIPRNLIGNNGIAGSNGVPLSAVPAGQFNTTNPVESAYVEDYDGGRMDGFARNSGSQSMSYFTQAQFAIEWDWAEEYGLGDNYFSSVLSETTPNRLYALAGNSSVTSDYGPPPYMNVNQTIFSELSNAGVSWGYYGAPGDDYYNTYPLDFFSGMNQVSFKSNIFDWGDFASQLNSTSLPSFCYISSLGYEQVDQHPSDNVTSGELWLLQIVNEVMKSSYWSSSVIFINYDEGGGYYDQVPPPIFGGVQLGFRVPLLVISPYSKENYVSGTEMNHASILAFLDYNWNLQPLDTFVGESYIPLDFFDFTQSPRAPLILANSSTFPVELQISLGQLPYSRTGSSAVNLLGTVPTSSLASITTASSTGGALTFQELLGSGITVIVVVLIIIGVSVVVIRRRR